MGRIARRGLEHDPGALTGLPGRSAMLLPLNGGVLGPVVFLRYSFAIVSIPLELSFAALQPTNESSEELQCVFLPTEAGSAPS